jgi:mono/diheme cytochrome c family protein
MKFIRRTFALILALVLFVTLSSAAFAQDPANGKVIWEQQVWQCMQCHGDMGQGVFGAPLAGTTKTAEEFITQVRTPRNRMPHFSTDQVSDDQIRDIQAYMASLPEPTQFGFKEITLPPDAPEGQKLIVEKRCVACHTETGPVSNFVERGATPSTEAVIKQLRTPFKNMPSFSADQVSDEEAALIADFVIEQISAQTPPATLPQSGSANSTTHPLTLLLLGGGLVIMGLTLYLRKAAVRS